MLQPEYLMSVNPNDVNQDKHNPWKAAEDLYRYISKKFYVTSFGKIDSQPLKIGMRSQR